MTFFKRAWDYFSKPKLRMSANVCPFGLGIELKEPYSFQWSLTRNFLSKRDAEKFIGILKPDPELGGAEFF